MALRFMGSTSDDGNCPTLYEDTETGEYIVQGYEVDSSDPEIRNVLPGETFVRVPRELLTRFAPKD